MPNPRRFLTPYDTTLYVHSLVDHLVLPSQLPSVQSITVASYNVRNLFGRSADSWTPGKPKPKRRAESQALTDVIAGLAADVIAFQEVQNEKVLRDLFTRRNGINSRLDRGDRFTSFVCVPARDKRGINVALVTRLSVRSVLSFHDRDFQDPSGRTVRFSRDLLGIELYATPEYRFLMFVAHLKSKIRPQTAEVKRRAEAREIERILTEPVFGGNRFIDQDALVAGDMNSEPDEETIRILRGAKERLLTDPFQEALPDAASYPTALVRGRYPPQRLDYIFASPSMRARVKRRTAVIHRGAAADRASDHYPISIDIDVRVDR